MEQADARTRRRICLSSCFTVRCAWARRDGRERRACAVVVPRVCVVVDGEVVEPLVAGVGAKW